MKNVNFSRHLGAVSALALTAAAAIASVQPAAAAEGIYGGGASLPSLALRQLADCYHGLTPTGAPATPAICATAGRGNANVELLYASVGSTAGRRGFLSNDSRQLVGGNLPKVQLPAVNPQFLDTAGFLPFAYPYARGGVPSIDFGASEAPLPLPVAPATQPSVTPFTGFAPATGWETLAPAPTPVIDAVNGAAQLYNPANTGKIIQIPFAEVGVAIGVNAPRPGITRAPWAIAYQGPYTMHLSQAQICAIFSAAVSDWDDSTTSIAYRDAANALQSELFDANNGGAPYTTASLPIKVAYRSDGSGTTFIMLSWLNAVCPFFDDGGNQYTQIFGAPTNNFSDLISRINTAFPARAAITSTWIGSTGNSLVAASIGNYASNASFSGRIGYISNDFAKPYSKLSNAPYFAAVQNEAQRLAGVIHASAGNDFMPPAPANISKTWAALTVPSISADYTGWDVYKQTHSVYGGQQKSRLAVPLDANAYPLTGTSFLDFYACYADPTGARVTAITDFLSWLYAGSAPTLYPAGTPATSTRNAPTYDAQVKAILNSNGFAPLPRGFGVRILNQFVSNSLNSSITSYTVPRTKGCGGVTGGGAK